MGREIYSSAIANTVNLLTSGKQLQCTQLLGCCQCNTAAVPSRMAPHHHSHLMHCRGKCLLTMLHRMDFFPHFVFFFLSLSIRRIISYFKASQGSKFKLPACVCVILNSNSEGEQLFYHFIIRIDFKQDFSIRQNLYTVIMYS